MMPERRLIVPAYLRRLQQSKRLRISLWGTRLSALAGTVASRQANLSERKGRSLEEAPFLNCCGLAGLTAALCPAALHAASHVRLCELRAASHAAPGDLHVAPDVASSRLFGPQHLTPLAPWLALRRPKLLVPQWKPLLRRIVREGKPLYDATSFPI